MAIWPVSATLESNVMNVVVDTTPAVCDRRFKTLNAEASARSVEGKGEPAAVSGYTGLISPGKPNKKGVVEENYVYLQTAQALPDSDERNPIAPRQVRMIFDSASQRSYVAKHVVDALKLHTVRTETLGISTFGNSAEEVKSCRLVELFVQNPETKFGLNLEAFEIPMICRDLTRQNIQWVKEKYPYLADLTFSDESPSGKELKVDILIGCDQMWSFIEDKKIRGEKGEPVAIYTKLGWTISGPVKGMPKANLTSTNFISTQVLRFETNILNDHDSNKILSEQINEIWDLDSIGIGDSTDSVHKSFLKNVEFKDGRYSVNLPWKEHRKTSPDNYENCGVRLKSLLRKLRQEPELLTNYDQIIRQQLEAGIIDRVDPLECAEVENVHYLPHHCVVRKEALSTKLRIVFDGSSRASFKSPSLNECLETGPSLSPTILDILLRFREKKIGLTGDIQSAFLNTELNEKDRDVLRFLWVENVEDEIPQIMILRFNRVTFGVGPPPFLLNATLRHHLSRYEEADPELIQELRDSFYIDDLTTGEEDDQSAFDLYKKSKTCLEDGSFHLRKWRSNSEALMEMIKADRLKTESLESNSQTESHETLEDDQSFAKM